MTIDPVREFIVQANGALEGTPYSIDTDETSKQRLVAVASKVSRTQQALTELPSNDSLPAPIRKMLQTREVFESNAIEGAGLPLSDTKLVLEQYPVGREPTSDFVRWAVEQALTEDRRVYEVVGLEAARRLAGELAGDLSRQLSEADLRSLHKVIMGDEPSAGQYKRFANAIAGSQHETSTPVDTPGHMRELSSWMVSLPSRPYRTIGSVIRAAAAHAWLAHIHPFEDGNGRLARLVANVMLSREGMPPLILRNKGDRAKYIDALALSDEAGDISRLVLVISAALERVADQLTDPVTAMRLFEQDVNLREQGVFSHWDRAYSDWVLSIRAEHRLLRLDSEVVGGLTPSDFESLRKRKSVSRAWFLEVSQGESPSGMWFFGYPGERLWSHLEQDQMFPVLFFSVRDDDPLAPKPFFMPMDDRRSVIRSVMLEPTEGAVYAQDALGRVMRMSPEAAASEMAQTSASFADTPAVRR